MSMNVGSSSRNTGGRRKQTPDINVTPLVDVMLVLLVIFMITIQAAKDQIPMELPQAAGKPEKQDKQPMEVNIDEHGKIHAAGKSMEIAEAEAELPKMLEGHENEAITLNAHRKLPYETVVKVIAAIRGAGVETLNISVDGSGNSGAPAAGKSK
jgi:biopolymer transport protein ExbD